MFMVWVEGKQGPTVPHETYSSAALEAERLAREPNVQGRKVYVLESIRSCQIIPPDPRSCEVKWDWARNG